MKTLIITGGGFEKDFVALFLQNNTYDYVIAVDNGLSYAKTLGIAPDMICGDFDTYGTKAIPEYEGIATILQSVPQKDDTDTEMAIRAAVGLNSDMDIICAMGGRMDHFLGTLQSLKIALDAGLSARIIDSRNIIELKDKPFRVSKKNFPHKYISFIPFSGEVPGLTIEGLKYTCSDYTLTPGITRCVSNEFVGEDEGSISFTGGILTVLNSGDIG